MIMAMSKRKWYDRRCLWSILICLEPSRMTDGYSRCSRVSTWAYKSRRLPSWTRESLRILLGNAHREEKRVIATLDLILQGLAALEAPAVLARLRAGFSDPAAALGHVPVARRTDCSPARAGKARAGRGGSGEHGLPSLSRCWGFPDPPGNGGAVI